MGGNKKKNAAKQDNAAAAEMATPTGAADRDRERAPPGKRGKGQQADDREANGEEAQEDSDADRIVVDDSEKDEGEPPAAATQDLTEWKAVNREQLLAVRAAMLPTLVDNHIMTLIEPLKADPGEIRKRQVASDKMVTRLSEEVIAMRVIGQATQDPVAELSSRTSQLTKTRDAIVVEQERSAAASSSAT